MSLISSSRHFCIASLLLSSTSVVADERKAASLPAPTFQAMATVTYETGFDFEDYDTLRDSFPDPGLPTRNWGEHPILWKELVTPGLTLDPSTPDPNVGWILFDGTPTHYEILVGDSDAFNTYEASGAFTDAAGNVVDPVGRWVEEFVTDGAETAIKAAMMIWRWNSPVYVNLIGGNSNGWSVGVIDSVTLSTPSGVPHVVCGWDDPDQDPSCAGLVIEAIKMTYYTQPTLCCGVQYQDGPPLLGAEFVQLYDSSTQAGPVIYDPPAVDELEAADLDFLQRVGRVRALGVRLRGSNGTLVRR